MRRSLEVLVARRAQRFISSQDGAVTVDWVVLTACLLLLGVIVAGPISRSAVDLSKTTADEIRLAYDSQVSR